MPWSITSVGGATSSTNAISYGIGNTFYSSASSYLICVGSLRGDSVSPGVPALSLNDNSALTYSEVTTNLYDPAGTTRGRITAWQVRCSSDTTGSVTADFGSANTQDAFASLVVVVSGHNPAALVQQSIISGANSSSVTANLAAFQSTTNAAIAFLNYESTTAGVTPDTGWVELVDAAVAGGEALTQHSMYTTVEDSTISATLPATAIWGLIALELNETAAGGGAAVASPYYLQYYQSLVAR